jgi:uncharacterized membrane protein
MTTDNGRPKGAAEPMDRLKTEAVGLLGALSERAVTALRDRVEDTAGRLSDYSHDGGGGAGMLAALTGAKGLAEGKGPIRSLARAGLAGLKEKVTGMSGQGGGKGSKGKGMKVTNIVEQIDVGAPIDLTYDLWTQFADFPSFMKKVESVEQEEDEKLNWRAQILWSHRNWEATILEQTPEEKIIWRSEGAKGYVDGAVTFHEIAPRLTRIMLVLEYHPQGFFELTGNLWRAQGRRVRLELKHFRRHLMSEVLLHPDEVDGWRGEIHDGKVIDAESDEGESGWDDAGGADSSDDVREPDRGERAERGRFGADDEGPDRGERAGGPRHADLASRTDRMERRRGSESTSGQARARRPTDEPRRAGARPGAGGAERTRSDRSGRPAATRRSAS